MREARAHKARVRLIFADPVERGDLLNDVLTSHLRSCELSAFRLFFMVIWYTSLSGAGYSDLAPPPFLSGWRSSFHPRNL